MILFFSKTKFKLHNKSQKKYWLKEILRQENKKAGDINFIFFDDEQLSVLNKKYLNHDTLTDIITFDYSENDILHGDICISIERIKENAAKYNCTLEEELRRIMAHGILHLCGYKDKTKNEKLLMKLKEENALILFNDLYNF